MLYAFHIHYLSSFYDAERAEHRGMRQLMHAPWHASPRVGVP